MNGGWRRFLPQGTFARSVAKVAGGAAIAQAVGILATPWLTRLYGPSDFGLLAVYVSLISTLSVAASLRFEVAIPIPAEDGEAVAVVGAALGSILITTVLTCVALWFLRGWLPGRMGAPTLRPWLWTVPAAMALLGLYQVFSYWALRVETFGAIARTRVSQGIATVVGQGGFGLLKLGGPGLVLGDLLGRGAGVGTLARLAWIGHGGLFRSLRWKGIKQAVSRFRDFPLYGTPAAVFNNAGISIHPLLFAALFSPQVAGWFAMTHRLISLPMVLVGQAVAQVYMAEAARAIREEPAKLPVLVHGTAMKLLKIGLPAMVVLAILGPWGAAKIFGAAWVESGVLIRILAPMYLLQFVVTPMSQTLNLLERQKLQFLWDLGRLITTLASLILPARWGLSHRVAITVFSLGMTVCYAIMYVMVQFHARRAAGQGEGPIAAS